MNLPELQARARKFEQRLRKKRQVYNGLGTFRDELVNPDGPEAADAIAALLTRIEKLEGGLEPFAKIPLCYPRIGSKPQVAKLDAPAPMNAYTADDVVRARKLLP